MDETHSSRALMAQVRELRERWSMTSGDWTDAKALEFQRHHIEPIISTIEAHAHVLDGLFRAIEEAERIAR